MDPFRTISNKSEGEIGGGEIWRDRGQANNEHTSGTPKLARSLPPGTEWQMLRRFKVLKPFEVESGMVAPAFGHPGLGRQYWSPVRLEILLKRGILEEIR